MGQTVYRANLSAKTFPFLSKNWGRSVIIQGYDNTFSRQLASTEDPDKDVGLPQIYYCHNVIPHSQGFQSVGYKTVFPGDSVAWARDIIPIRNDAGVPTYARVVGAIIQVLEEGVWVSKFQFPPINLTYCVIGGTTYIYNSGSNDAENNGLWYYDFVAKIFVKQPLNGLSPINTAGVTASNGYLIAWETPPGSASNLRFTAHLNREAANTPSPITTRFISVTPSDLVSTLGLKPLDKLYPEPGYFSLGGEDYQIIATSTEVADGYGGVPTAYPYLLLMSHAPTVGGHPSISMAADAASAVTAIPTIVRWSSALTPFDFTPSLSTGAGSGEVELAQGAIVACLPTPAGFNIYTTNNAVAAVFSGDPRYPFNFRGIASSSGISSAALVTDGAEQDSHLIYGTSGAQLISTSRAVTVFPELTDFLSGEIFEDYVNGQFSYVQLTETMEKAVTVIANRYMVFSYGLPDSDAVNSGGFIAPLFSHAIIYDLTSKRWGKLKIDHVKCFEYILPTDSIKETPRQSMGFLGRDGSIKVADFSRGSLDADGLIILGKYQLSRSRLLQLDEIYVEQLFDVGSGEEQLEVHTSLDGYNTTSKIVPTVLQNLGDEVTYGCRTSGINHSILVKGRFALTSLVMAFNVHGRR